MKLFKTIAILALCGPFAQASASSFISCDNGSFEEQGDWRYVVNIKIDGLEFLPHESYWMVNKSDIQIDNFNYVIENHQVELSSEGMTEMVDFSANLNLTDDFRLVGSTVFRGQSRDLDLTCKVVSE